MLCTVVFSSACKSTSTIDSVVNILSGTIEALYCVSLCNEGKQSSCKPFTTDLRIDSSSANSHTVRMCLSFAYCLFLT